MLGNHVILSFFLHGTLAADHVFAWTVPDPGFHVKEVSEAAQNNSAALSILGISSDTNSILTSAVIGDSGTPTTKALADFATTNPTGQLNPGDILTYTLDHDGVSGTAAQNVS